MINEFIYLNVHWLVIVLIWFVVSVATCFTIVRYFRNQIEKNN